MRTQYPESPSPKWLPLEKMSTELLIFAQPKLGLRNRGSHWTRERFLLNHRGCSTDDEYATTSLIAMTPATAISRATTILMVNCRMLLRMVSPHPSGAGTCVLVQLQLPTLSNKACDACHKRANFFGCNSLTIAYRRLCEVCFRNLVLQAEQSRRSLNNCGIAG